MRDGRYGRQGRLAAPASGVRARGGLLVLALAIGCFGSAAHCLHSVLRFLPRTAAAARPTDASVVAEREREAILSLVREHRRQAGDAWRQTLAEAVYLEAREADMDPLLVAAMVATESSFKSRIVSKAGAVGLMQLRPFVARDVALRGAVEWTGPETLNQPEVNVRLGILYFRELLERFDGDPHAALTAYNYGPTRVHEQIRDGRFEGSDYARRILDLYEELRGRRDTSQVPRSI